MIDDIKQQISMYDICRMYGIRLNPKNYCNCPFHSEKTPSMKIYKDGFKCYGCGESGDIFTFVEKMEGCDFKEAYLKLGGTYENKPKREQKLNRIKYERQRRIAQNTQKAEIEFKQLLSNTIRFCRKTSLEKPYTDVWTVCVTWLDWLLACWEEKYIGKGEINRGDVIRICKRIERVRDSQ